MIKVYNNEKDGGVITEINGSPVQLCIELTVLLMHLRGQGIPEVLLQSALSLSKLDGEKQFSEANKRIAKIREEKEKEARK